MASFSTCVGGVHDVALGFGVRGWLWNRFPWPPLVLENRLFCAGVPHRGAGKGLRGWFPILNIDSCCRSRAVGVSQVVVCAF